MIHRSHVYWESISNSCDTAQIPLHNTCNPYPQSQREVFPHLSVGTPQIMGKTPTGFEHIPSWGGGECVLTISAKPGWLNLHCHLAAFFFFFFCKNLYFFDIISFSMIVNWWHLVWQNMGEEKPVSQVANSAYTVYCVCRTQDCQRTWSMWSLKLAGTSTAKKKQPDPIAERKPSESKPEELPEDINPASAAKDASGTGLRKGGEKTLKDAVKPKHKRKKRQSSTADAS